MGHDITAYKVKEVAHNRRNAFNMNKEILYQALKCEDLNAGVSGCGNYRSFDLGELLNARKFLENIITDTPEAKQELEFIEKCIKETDSDILIYFG